jgi:peptide/nickel transport system permease protein
MLNDLLRRLLWVPPLALLVSALAFSLVSTSASATAGAYRHLPRFFNTNPQDAPTLALGALARLRTQTDPEATATLVRLGGAALPVVLPALEGLAPDARARVVVALRPAARRMGFSPPTSPDQEALWWRHFWEDRALDFHAPAIRRLAHRYALSPSSARRQELRILDTAALPDLFAELGIDGPQPAPPLVGALLPVLQQALERPPVAPEQTPQEVLALRAFWFAHRLDYSALDGAGRATALLLETQYGKWVQRTLLERATRSPRASVAASSPLRTLLRRGRGTLARVILGGALSLAIAWLWLRLLGGRPRGKALTAAVFALVPAGFILTPPSEVAAVVLIAATLLPGSWGRVAELWGRERSRPGWPERRAWGGGVRGPRGALALVGRGVAQDLGLASTVALLAEGRWRLPGLGSLLLAALKEQDATVLMAFSVACVVVVQGASMTAGALELWGDPRREGLP